MNRTRAEVLRLIGMIPEIGADVVADCILSVTGPHCKVTGNTCGTDTWSVGWSCKCAACQFYLTISRSDLAVRDTEAGAAVAADTAPTFPALSAGDNMTPAHESTLPPVLFIEHLAALLGTSPRTIRRARLRRNWPFTELAYVGRKPRWSRDQVLATLSAGRHVRRSA